MKTERIHLFCNRVKRTLGIKTYNHNGQLLGKSGLPLEEPIDSYISNTREKKLISLLVNPFEKSKDAILNKIAEMKFKK